MGAMQRRKGAKGEREFLNKLSELMGIEKLGRNLTQTRSGGCDCIELPGLAIEVKRAKKPLFTQWMNQAIENAETLGCVPILAYRLDRQEWNIKAPLSWVAPAIYSTSEVWVTMNLAGFVEILERKEIRPVEAA